jgi:hypothetical protein
MLLYIFANYFISNRNKDNYLQLLYKKYNQYLIKINLNNLEKIINEIKIKILNQLIKL